MLRSRETHQYKQKNMTNVACFNGQHFSFLEVFEIPLVLLAFAITLKGIKVTRTTFWLKCKKSPNCIKFCSTHKLEVAGKCLVALTKNHSWIGKYGGLKTAYYQRQYSGCILESLSLHFACVNRCTRVILLPVDPQESLLMIIK